MNTLPRRANDLLHAFGVDPAVIGDLEEALRTGRSRTWYWRQVIGIVFFGSMRQLVAAPMYAMRGLMLGWLTLLLTFALVDLPVVARLRIDAYVTGQWMPWWAAAFCVSYAGFALSAWAVTRLHRRSPGPLLILHIAVVVFTMAVGEAVREIREPATLWVPHVLFPLVSVAAPYQWRSGFVLVPAVMWLTGMLVLRPAVTARASRSS
jgi:hypothetical protein